MRTTLILMAIGVQFAITFLEALLTNTLSFSNPVTTAMSLLFNPNIVSSNNWLAQIMTWVTNINPIINALLKIFLMYSPTVFGGDRIWLWLPFAGLGLVTTLSIILGIFGK